ncbi:MAG: bifunctional enoyl-CoA hydratase/phosphate acetyltransferase [Chloroflexota bacterium]
MLLRNLDSFIEIAKSKPKKKIAIAAAEDEPVLIAANEAFKQGIAEPILVGDNAKIQGIADRLGLDISGFEIINEQDPSASARKAVKIILEGRAQILMKGLVSSADFLRAVLNKEQGLRKGDLLSHIGFFDPPTYPKLIAITDAAQNVAPDFNEKVGIIKNAVDLFHRLGVANPKIAVVAAVETVNPKMPATIDAALLTMMNKRNQIKGCIIDGPLALDNSISAEAAHHKGIDSLVSGDADLLMMPDIEAANALYKSLTYFAGASVAACILGAAVPIVLTSRSDTDRSKLTSLALAASF